VDRGSHQENAPIAVPALQYHFGSKEELIRRLLVEGAKALEDRRNHLPDAIEQSGEPVTVRDPR
jgi:AcrR family transcriptional regulator